jgi:hypothetical protein
MIPPDAIAPELVRRRDQNPCTGGHTASSITASASST